MVLPWTIRKDIRQFIRNHQFDREIGDWFGKTSEKGILGFNWNGFVQLRRQVSTNVYVGDQNILTFQRTISDVSSLRKARLCFRIAFFNWSMFHLRLASTKNGVSFESFECRHQNWRSSSSGIASGGNREDGKRENRGNSIENHFLR